MSSYGMRLPNVFGDYTTAQTNTELVAAVSGKRIGVAAVYVMSAAAGTVTFESDGAGVTVIFEVYPGANGGVQAVAPDGQFLFTTVAGEALDVTTTITGDHAVNVLYQVV